jgi:hypothetical protein
MESRHGEGERSGEVRPHGGADEVCELERVPRRFEGVVRERVAWLIEGLKDGSVVGLDRDSFGGERAASVGRAEWTV